MHLHPVRPRRDLPRLERLFELVTECDGHRPIGEHKYLDLRQASSERLVGLVADEGGEAFAYVALSPTREPGTWAMELAVHPLRRSRREVRELVDDALERVALEGGARVRVWAFQPHFVAVLEEAGFVPERELRQLRRRLPVAERPRFPSGVRVAGFRPGIDEDTWLQVNNAAFAGHPENGAWTREVLEDREAQPWFDPEGFRMAWQGDHLLGFCWTKVHGTGGDEGPSVGEIYVVAVNPSARGSGLGRALVLEGLRHVWEANAVPTAMLYVDADNLAALRLYEGLGFRLDHVDRSLVKALEQSSGR